MRKVLENKYQKIEYIIHELEYLKGLEFIYKDEIHACNLAIQVLKNYINKSLSK